MTNNNFTIFCDFDGTITKQDAVNKFLSFFADDEWLNVESKWEKGLIGSKECIVEQIRLVPEISKGQLDEFINSIEIDEYFIEFYNHMKERQIPLYIVSDGFDLFIRETLRKYELDEIQFFANTLNYDGKNLSVDFNHSNPSCKRSSGVCKCSIVNKYNNFGYIGDGLSDTCAADRASLIFAKKRLEEYCTKKEINHVKFSTFRDILDYFIVEGELNVKTSYNDIRFRNQGVR